MRDDVSTPTTFDRKELDRMAAEWRYVITDMICRAGSGHLGGALSLVEVVITLYYRIMRVDPRESALGGAGPPGALERARRARCCTWRWPSWASFRRPGWGP